MIDLSQITMSWSDWYYHAIIITHILVFISVTDRKYMWIYIIPIFYKCVGFLFQILKKKKRYYMYINGKFTAYVARKKIFYSVVRSGTTHNEFSSPEVILLRSGKE